MFTNVIVLAGAMLVAAQSGPTSPVRAETILGQWTAQEGDCRFEFTQSDGKFYGKIVWLKEPVYGKDDKEAGKTIHDRHNPDKSKRDTPLVGLTILKDFKYSGENSWTGGTIYNPDDGRTYSAKMWLQDDTHLKVRGYIGVSLLGGNTTWTRYQPEPAPVVPPNKTETK